MVKKSIAVLMLVFLSIAGLFAGDYDELREVMEEILEVQQDLIDGLDGAETAEEVASVIVIWGEALNEIGPKMTAIEEKYPEIVDMQEPPEEVADIAAELEALDEKLATSMMKIYSYYEDPAVQEAMESLQ